MLHAFECTEKENHRGHSGSIDHFLCDFCDLCGFKNSELSVALGKKFPMRELIACWQHTRMIVLIALCAALYTAVLLAFKWLPIIPGITEIRPACVIPILFSVFFGPAAAWGSAFGNIVGDVLGGTIGPGSLFGFFGNFIFGYAPYRVLRTYSSEEKISLGPLVFGIFLASSLCAVIIALGVDFLKLVPFSFLVHTIFLNNFVVSIFLGPLLIRGLQKRIYQMRLTYRQMMEPQEISGNALKWAGPILVLALMLLIYGVMMIPSLLTSAPGSVFKVSSTAILFLASLILL